MRLLVAFLMIVYIANSKNLKNILKAPPSSVPVLIKHATLEDRIKDFKKIFVIEGKIRKPNFLKNWKTKLKWSPKGVYFLIGNK
ncbi:MAG: hypothetical protein GXO02_00810 [Epsilonproteobacteria bacterium]|nr:hypothetical protein [Campylobacterota bacterium]